jgi:hypothetical protein
VKRAHSMVCREIAKYLDPPTSYLSVGFDGPVISVAVLQRWLLLLAPPKKKRPRDPVRGARRASVKELDALCREVVFLRDGNKCRKCGKEATDWCHVHTRGVHSLRWDLDNSFAGCRGCHMNFWHKQPTLAAQWWKDEIGDLRFLRLNARAAKPSRVNHVAVRAYLEQERKKLA